jgi:hypothetical protein
MATAEDKDWKRISLTPIVEKEDGTNNYHEFSLKSQCKLEAARYWKFISGPDYAPPNIPPLHRAQQIHGDDENGNPTVITTRGNEQEVAAANEAAKPWKDGDRKTLAIIIHAVPVTKLWLAQECPTANSAWMALRRHYEPANSLTVI